MRYWPIVRSRWLHIGLIPFLRVYGSRWSFNGNFACGIQRIVPSGQDGSILPARVAIWFILPGRGASHVISMGYWPSVRSRWLDIGQVLFCVFREGDEVEVHKLAKIERGQYPAILTEQTLSIKDLLYGFRGSFACGIQRVVPSGQDGAILPARVANHSMRFRSSCPMIPRLRFWCVIITTLYQLMLQSSCIKKLPNHWWTRWYYFGTVKFFLIMEF